MAVRQASPFDAIDQVLSQVDQKQAERNLLAMAKEYGLRVTSGYSSGGHNTGSRHYQGSKDNPGAIDIDHRNVAPETINSIRSKGFRVLDERTRPAGQAVWGGPHYHIDLGGSVGPSAKQKPATKQQAVQAPKVAPIDLGRALGEPLVMDANGNLVVAPEKPNTMAAQAKQAASISVPQAPLSMPKQAQATNKTDVFSNIDSLLADAAKPQPKLVAKPQQDGFDLGKMLQETAGQAISGVQAQVKNATAPSKDLGEAVYKAVIEQNPFVQAGAGALSETVNLANGITDLAGLGRFIPTGDLEKFTAKAPIYSTVGRALPYIAGEGAVLKAGERFAPALTKAITSSPLARTASGAAVNAVEGYLVDPKEAGQEGRIANAALGGLLGGALHGAGELIAAKTKRVPVEVAPEPPVKSELVQQLEQPLKPAELNPIEATAKPQELTQAFKRRGGDLGQPSRNLDAQIVDASGKPIVPEDTGRLKSAYEIALERSRKSIDLAGPSAKNALPQESPILTPRALDTEPAGQLLDAQGRPMARDLGAVEQPKIDLSEQRKVPSQLLDSTGQPLELSPEAPVSRDLAAPKLSEKTTQVSDNVAKTAAGKEVFTQGRDPVAVQDIASKVNRATEELVNLEDAERLLQDKGKMGLLTPDDIAKQTDALRLFVEAGRNGKTFNSMRREIQEGLGAISEQLGKAAVKAREDLNPFAVTVRSRKPTTEVNNLIKQLGSAEAAQAKMRELASQFGITPTTKSVSRTGFTPDQITKSNAVAIAKQIAAHPKGRLYFSDVYLNAHNFKTGGIKTAFDAPRSYPLRTFEQAAIGDKSSFIPTGSQHTNQISQQFQSLQEISSAAHPELKQRIDTMLQKPNPTRNDIKRVRELLQDTKTLETFCQLFGHG